MRNVHPDSSSRGATHSPAVSDITATHRQIAYAAIDNLDPELRDINLKIHDNPELGFEEFQAHDNIVGLLESLGISVTKHAFGLATSFLAEYGSGGRVVTFNAEYDALPDIGHACGHNLIATAGIAGFLGVVRAIQARQIPGRVQLLGTPAEEGMGGKIKLIKAGAYRGVDACMMVHPGPPMKDAAADAYVKSLANSKFRGTFIGKPAHAAASPEQGINALDAVVLAYNGISMLRQQIKPSDRIHGVIVEGGTRPSIITPRGTLEFYIRSITLGEVQKLVARVKKCFEGAATATGCKVEYEELNEYSDMRPNRPLCTAYTAIMADLGAHVTCDFDSPTAAHSTDQGNVSYEIPAIHPGYGIPAKSGAFNHTVGFTEAAATLEAHSRTVLNGKAMAGVALKVLIDDEFALQVKTDFENDKALLSGS